MSGEAFDRVAAALLSRGTPLNKANRAPCPAHRGSDPNLVVRQGERGVLLSCHSHDCSARDIARALGLAAGQLFDDWEGPFHQFKPEISFVYQDEAGNSLFRVVRSESYESGRRTKRFRQERFDVAAGRYIGGPGAMDGVRRVLYGLPRVIEAVREGETIYIVEGEKAAEAMHAVLGVAATTASGGAGKWNHSNADPSYAESLRDAHVVLLPDNDLPGERHMQDVARALVGVAASVRVVQLPDLPEKGDAVEWLESGGTLRALEKVVEARPPLTAAADSAEPELKEAEGAASALPELNPAALHGIVGKIVTEFASHTEAAPAAILATVLAMLGSLMGRGPHQMLGGVRHPGNIFVLLVGPSSSGRKGTAVALARQVLRALDQDFERKNAASGLSSGQGLIFHVRDPAEAPAAVAGERPKAADPGVADKRLLVLEAEFGGVLRQMRGRENTLSPVLREAWDGTPLGTLTRRDPLRATDAHVTLIAQITPDELRTTAAEVDYTSGLLNRFLLIYCERTKLLPHGEQGSVELPAESVQVLKEAIEFARTVACVDLDENARRAWERAYAELTTGPTGRLGALTRRGAPIVRRLAALYALLDKSRAIQLAHLSAALALWRYATDSARLALGEAPLTALARKFLAKLDEAGALGLDRAALRQIAGSNNVRGDKIDAALNKLLIAGLARPSSERDAGVTNGRPREVWRHIRYSLPTVGNMGRMGGNSVTAGDGGSVSSHSSHKSHRVDEVASAPQAVSCDVDGPHIQVGSDPELSGRARYERDERDGMQITT